MTVQFSDAIEAAFLEQIEVVVGASPILQLYSGIVPLATSDQDPSGLLVQLTLPADWAANATAAQKDIIGPWVGLIAASGTAASFRIKAGTTTHIQGTVSVVGAGGDMQLVDTALVQGRTLRISSGSFGYLAQTPPYQAPSWSNIPNINAINGIRLDFSFAGLVAEGTYPATFSGTGLPPGWTVDSAAKMLRYDGSDHGAQSSTARLIADDGYADHVDLTTLTVREAEGTTAMPFAKAEVPAGYHLSSDLVGFQAVVKNRWSDGSVKLAILSWQGAPGTPIAPHTIEIRKIVTPASQTPVQLTTLRSSGMTGTLQIGAFGTIDIAALVATAPFRQWLSGPMCSEWHWRSNVGTDEHLGVWLYVRLYSNGSIWVRTIVENGYVLKSAHSSQTYRAVLTLGGTTRYDSTTNLTHWCRCRWTRADWYSGRAQTFATFDPVHFLATKVTANYGYTPTANAYTYTPGDQNSGWNDNSSGQSSTPVTALQGPFGKANQRADMTTGGATPTIGLLPQWDVLWLKTQREDGYWCMLANALAGGSYNIHLRKHGMSTATDYLPIRPSEYPLMWIQQQGDPNCVYPGAGGSPYEYETAHAPSMSYMAFLCTGDYYFVEQAQFQCLFNWSYPSYADAYGREGRKSIWKDQVRQSAWGMRDLAYAITITPDGDAMQDELRFQFNANVQRWFDTAISGNFIDARNVNYQYARNNLGVLWTENGDSGTSPYRSPETRWHIYAPWQINYLAAVLALSQDLEVVSGADKTKLDAVTMFTLTHPVWQLGDGTTGFPYTWGGGAYDLPYMKPCWYPPQNGANQWAADSNQVFLWYVDMNIAYHGSSYEGPETDIRPVANGSPIEGSYVGQGIWAISRWGYLQPAISYAVDRGIAGAAAAWGRMTGASNWSANATFFNDRGMWAVKPRTV